MITGSRSLHLCIAIGALQMMINYGVMGFTPSFLMKHFGLSPAKTGLQFGLLAAAIGIVGPLISGPLSDRINARFPAAGRAYVTLFSLALSPLLAIWVYGANNPASFYTRFVLYSLVLTAWLPPLYAILFEQVLPRMRGLTPRHLHHRVYDFRPRHRSIYCGHHLRCERGNLAAAILGINWVAPMIVVMLLILARRARVDEDRVLERARSAGEPI